MYRSAQVAAKCFFRSSQGRPRLIHYGGSNYLEFISVLKEKFSPTFNDVSIDDMQLFKADSQMIAQNINEIFTEDCKIEENAVVVGLRRKKISISQGLGEVKSYEVVSNAHLTEILKKEGGQCLLDHQGLDVVSYAELEDNVTYGLRILKVTVLDEWNCFEEKSFKNHEEFSNYLKSEKIRGLATTEGEIVSDFSKLKDRDVLNKPKQVKLLTFNSTTNFRKEETRFFYSDMDFEKFLSSRDLFGIFESPELEKAINFDSMRPEKTYFCFPRDSLRNWDRNHISFLEDEARLAAKKKLAAWLKGQNLDPQVFDKPRKFYTKVAQKFAEIVQEWDAVFYSESTDCLYLFECKHQMRTGLLEEIQERISKFMDMIKDGQIEDKENITKQFKATYKEVKGIVCADQFPQELRNKAKSFGLITMVRSDINQDDWILDEF
jgi:hypothetical protein